MTALLHSHDGDGTPLPADGRHRTSVHVRGGVGATRVDVAELRHIEGRLEEVVQDTAQLAPPPAPRPPSTPPSTAGGACTG